MVQRVSLKSQWQYGEEEEWRLSAASCGATDGSGGAGACRRFGSAVPRVPRRGRAPPGAAGQLVEHLVRGHSEDMVTRPIESRNACTGSDEIGSEQSQGTREAVRGASSRSENSLTEISALDRPPAHGGAPSARVRTRTEASLEEVTRTPTTPTTAGSHRPQRGSSRHGPGDSGLGFGELAGSPV